MKKTAAHSSFYGQNGQLVHWWVLVHSGRTYPQLPDFWWEESIKVSPSTCLLLLHDMTCIRVEFHNQSNQSRILCKNNWLTSCSWVFFCGHWKGKNNPSIHRSPVPVPVPEPGPCLVSSSTTGFWFKPSFNSSFQISIPVPIPVSRFQTQFQFQFQEIKPSSSLVSGLFNRIQNQQF